MDEMKLDSESICRICLEDGGIFSLFEANDEMLVADKIMLCSTIQIREGDDFPTRICSVCNSMLGIALDFKSKCEESDATLRKYLATRAGYGVGGKGVGVFNVQFEVGVDPEPTTNQFEEGMDYDRSPDCISNPGDDDVKPKIEIQDEDDIPLLRIQLKSNQSNNYTKKQKKKRKGRKKLLNKEQKKLLNKNEKKARHSKTPSNIASSLLEGIFKWDANSWRHVKSSKLNQIPEKEEKYDSDENPIVQLSSRILREKQREIRKALKLKQKKEKQQQIIPSLCDHCGDQFNSKWRLRDHIRNKHLPKTVFLKCTYPGCKKIFNSNYYRSRHEKRIHSERKDFVCTECGRQFAFKNELITHAKKHDPVKYPKKLRKCKYCPQTYKTQKSTDIHERSVHTGERPAACTICEAAFYHEDYLKEHTRLHTGETPFLCPICGRGYAQRCNMKSHLRIHKVSELDEKTKLKMKPNYLKLLRDWQY